MTLRPSFPDTLVQAPVRTLDPFPRPQTTVSRQAVLKEAERLVRRNRVGVGSASCVLAHVATAHNLLNRPPLEDLYSWTEAGRLYFPGRWEDIYQENDRRWTDTGRKRAALRLLQRERHR